MTTDPPRVLLADCHMQASWVLCDTAEDGEIALEKIRPAEYDVVVLDLMMPKVNGYQVIEALRELSRRPASLS